MNCPSRVDADAVPNGWNQNPNALALDTNNDSNGIVNLRSLRHHRIPLELPLGVDPPIAAAQENVFRNAGSDGKKNYAIGYSEHAISEADEVGKSSSNAAAGTGDAGHPAAGWKSHVARSLRQLGGTVKKFGKFVGPGFMVAVAYIDPGMTA